MGNLIDKSSDANMVPNDDDDDWPYVWAIRDSEILDWRIHADRTPLTSLEIGEIYKAQQRLPVSFFFLSFGIFS